MIEQQTDHRAELLGHLTGAVDELRTRSGSHPLAEQAAEMAWRLVRRAILADGDLVIEAGDPIDDRRAAKFLLWMRERGIARLHLSRQTLVSDFRKLLRLFVRSASDCLSCGSLRPGVAQAMATIRFEASEATTARRSRPAPETERTARIGPRPADRDPLLARAAAEGVVGAASIEIERSGQPRITLFLSYFGDRVDLERLEEGGPAATASLPLGDPAVRPWNLVQRQTRSTPTSEDSPEARVRYRHRLVYVADVVLDNLWIDPDRASHPGPADLAGYYEGLLVRAFPAPPRPAGDVDDLCARTWHGLTARELIENPFLAYLSPEKRSAVLAALEAGDPDLAERVGRAIATYLGQLVEG